MRTRVATFLASVLVASSGPALAQYSPEATKQFVEAVERLEMNAVRNALDRGANPNATLRKLDQYGTPLHYAARIGDEALLILLLDHGANIQARMSGDYTPLHVAVREGKVNAVRLLIDRGADVNADIWNMGGPLHYAVYHGQAEIAKLLIDKGANVNLQNADRGNTPLHYIEIIYGPPFSSYTVRHEAAVQILLDAKPDLTLKNKKGTTVAEVLDHRPKPRRTPHPMDELIRKISDQPKQ